MTRLAFATMFSHGPLLGVHAAVGTLLVLTAIAALFAPWARRAVVYVLLVQVLIGGAASGMLKLTPPAPHWILAILAGGVYAAANAAQRKGRPPVVVRGLLVLGLLMIGSVYYLGEHALR